MRGIEDPIGIALCLDTLGWIAAGSQPRRAVVLLGAADAAWSAFLLALPPAFRERHDAALHGARAALPGSAYLAAFRKGNAMSQAEAIAFALGESPEPAPQSDGTQDGGVLAQLTRREQDVAMLVARGMSNSQIAATLVISARTVETHVQHIMDKFGVRTRAQIAAWSAAVPRPHGPAGPAANGSAADAGSAAPDHPAAGRPAAGNP